MAWVTPTNVATGDVLTASTWNQDVVANSLAGIPSFSNEAARDAAISSPAEGMTCYLTAPTVPAATGATTAVPSGITTIYNGSVWVCTTQVGAFTSAAGTTTSGGYTASLSGSPGTNPSVTLVTGTTALVHLAANLTTSLAGVGAVMSVAVTGAGTVGPSDDWWILTTGTATTMCGRTLVIPGLTAGTNTFTLNYRIGGAATTTVSYRTLVVQGVA